MQERPKILFVTSHWPDPVVYGGAHLRVRNISRLLGSFGNVSFVIVRGHPVDEETVRLNRARFDIRMEIPVLPVVSKGPFGRLLRRLRCEFDPRYLPANGNSISERDRTALLRLVRGHDLVWIQGIATANACQIEKWPCSVLDLEDVLSCWYRSRAQGGEGPIRRLLDLRHSYNWRRRERLFTERFDILTVCSESDRQYLGGHGGVHVIPNGFSQVRSSRRPASELSQFSRIGFIGTFGWEPSGQGVDWFVRNVWPIIKRELPQAELRLVGRGSEVCCARSAQGATGLGWLDDPSEEIATWSVMIVPIRFGGGTRLKMAEGFARKCPIVATTIGAFGYNVRDGEEFLLADDAHDFASACVRLVREPDLGRTLAERAHQRFLREWSWDVQEGKVRAVIRECLARSDRPQAGKAMAAEISQKSDTQGSIQMAERR